MSTSKTHSKEQISAFLEEIKTQTDRGAAVIAAAVLDDILKQILLARFIELGTGRREALFDKPRSCPWGWCSRSKSPAKRART
jgi:hypothetical protein